MAIKGSLAAPQAQHSISNPVNLETFAWPNSNGQEFQAGAPVVGLGGRILGIVAASSTRRGSGKGQPIVVPLSSGLLNEIIDRAKNRSSVLRLHPMPIAGREVTFTLKAQPGQIVRIAHLNPDGKKVAWVFPNGSTRSEDDEPITLKNRGADESGTVSWSRPGTLDLSGSWTVRVVFDPFTEAPDTVDFRYMLDELEVEGKAQDSIHLGIDLGVINHGDFSTYYSKSVPAAIALDSSSRLQFPVRRLSEIWGSNAVPNPDLYLTGTLEEYTALFEYVVGTSTTWQRPFYRSPRSRRTRDRPGVYVPLEKYAFEAGRHMILSHEHAHAMFYGMSVVKRPPNATWVNEGLAVWSEYEAGLEDGGELEVSRSKSRSVNRARSAVHSGNLFAMFDLESGKEWSGRTDDQRSLQYAQAYMAMRYMIERFGLP